MPITVTPPLVPSTVWNYGASVPYASFGVGQDLTVIMSPGGDSTILAVFLSASPVSPGTLPSHAAPPPGTRLVGVLYNGNEGMVAPDEQTRAFSEILIARYAGTNAATVTVTGNPAGTGTTSSIPTAYLGGAVTFSTSSATFVDVTGTTITLATTGSAQIQIHAAITYTGANNLSGEFRVIVDAQASDATPLDGTNTNEGADLGFQTSGLTAGTHTIKLQARKAGGSATLDITHADVTAFATQAIGGA